MKSIILLFVLVCVQSLSGAALASELHDEAIYSAIDQVDLIEASDRVTNKEVKAMISSLGAEATCLDEYLLRRNRLILSTALTPVKAAAFVGTGFTAGGSIAAAIVNSPRFTNSDGWNDLIVVLSGMAYGMLAGGVYSVVDTTVTVKQLRDTNQILKSIVESYQGEFGFHSEKLYAKYLKKHSNHAISKAAFQENLKQLDQSLALCDGTLGRTPKIRLFKKLKHRLANSTRIFTAFEKIDFRP